MNHPPKQIGEANVVLFTPIDKRHSQTGRCRQIVAGVLQGPAEGLAICQYEGDENFYLFSCDAAWNCVTDIWHQTIEDAMKQAEFEYEGVANTWQWIATSAP